jgi:hypothetical protein
MIFMPFPAEGAEAQCLTGDTAFMPIAHPVQDIACMTIQ